MGLQDEQFLIGAGLLQAGSQGQNFGQAIFPSIFQAQKVSSNIAQQNLYKQRLDTSKQTNKLRKIQIENAMKSGEISDFNLKKAEYDFDKIVAKDENIQALINSDILNEEQKAFLKAGIALPKKEQLKPTAFMQEMMAMGIDFSSPEFKKLWLQKNMKKGLDIQFDGNGNITSITDGGTTTNIDNYKEKEELKDLKLAKTYKTDYSVLEKTIKNFQSNVAESKTGLAGNLVATIDTFTDQLSQLGDTFKVTDSFKKSAEKEVSSWLKGEGITKDAQNYAALKSSAVNLAYVLAKIAEPGNPKYSEGDIKRQMDRIGWGGSRDQIIAALQRVLEEEWTNASSKYKMLDPDGVFGFENPEKKVAIINQFEENTTSINNDDPMGLKNFLQ
jgi:hypothetical protein